MDPQTCGSIKVSNEGGSQSVHQPRARKQDFDGTFKLKNTRGTIHLQERDLWRRIQTLREPQDIGDADAEQDKVVAFVYYHRYLLPGALRLSQPRCKAAALRRSMRTASASETDTTCQALPSTIIVKSMCTFRCAEMSQPRYRTTELDKHCFLSCNEEKVLDFTEHHHLDTHRCAKLPAT